jgi:formylglycine-generating enzyme required for sulfatase activity
MARIEKTVFISYRRTDVYTALAVYENLKNDGYDVFFDYRSIPSGDFEQIIISNIKARAHFILILTPTALDRCNEPGDWLRREIEIAMDEKRNIVPLFFKGFGFGAPSVTDKLTGKLKNLSRYNGLNVHEDYFDEAMDRLRKQYLNKPLNTVLHLVSTEVQKLVREEQVAADKALEQIEDIKELVKRADEKPTQLAEPDTLPDSKTSLPIRIPNFNFRLIGGFVGAVLLLILVVWKGASLFNSASSPEELPTSQLTALTSLPVPTNTTSPTQTNIPPTFNLGIGSTMISNKDDMILLYIPVGEFTMGSDDGEADEKPVHKVKLDPFWIDQTEITNGMYAKCVQDGACHQPSLTTSYTRDSYYGNSEFDNYPVIYVSWDDANAYCSWADRRLPTEAEWEKAARGPDASAYPWGNKFDGTRVNFCDKNCLLDQSDTSSDDGYADTAPVGSYPSGIGVYGVLDMAGNVWEWVADRYSKTYYASLPVSNPLGPDSGQYRVLRGGALTNLRDGVRSANRHMRKPALRYYNLGFRCAMSANP